MDDFDDRIGRKAHELWIAEGSPDGKHEEHWFRALDHVRTQDYEDLVANPHPAAEADCPHGASRQDPPIRQPASGLRRRALSKPGQRTPPLPRERPASPAGATP